LTGWIWTLSGWISVWSRKFAHRGRSVGFDAKFIASFYSRRQTWLHLLRGIMTFTNPQTFSVFPKQ
jgi:hypothetical protein